MAGMFFWQLVLELPWQAIHQRMTFFSQSIFSPVLEASEKLEQTLTVILD